MMSPKAFSGTNGVNRDTFALSPVQGDVILYNGLVYEVPFNWLTMQLRDTDVNKKLNKALAHRPIVQASGAFSCKRCDYHPHGEKVEFSMTGLHMAKGEPVANVESCLYIGAGTKIAHPLLEETTGLVAMVCLEPCYVDHTLVKVLEDKLKPYLKTSLVFDFPTPEEFLDLVKKNKNIARHLVMPSRLPPNFIGDKSKEVYAAIMKYFSNIK
jgi:hypothetical protein